MSMELPNNQHSSGLNQDQFRVTTLFDQKEGFEGNQNITLGQSNQQNNMFHKNNLISQMNNVQNTQDLNKNLRIQEQIEISEESMENITISPPRSPYPVHMQARPREVEHSYRTSRAEFQRRNFYEGEDHPQFRKRFDSTNTVKVDSDDEIYKQRDVLNALSASQLTYTNSENESFDQVRKSVQMNKNEFLKKQYYFDRELSPGQQRNLEQDVSQRGWVSRENQFRTQTETEPTSEVWGYSSKNWDNTHKRY